MQQITVFDISGNSIIDLVQWDKDVKIYIREDEIDKAYKVHFFNQNHQDTAMVLESTYQNDVLSVVVPNDLLAEPYTITGYIYVEKNNEHKSIYSFRIMVRKRPKPANYIYSDQKEYITFEKVLEEAKAYADYAQESADAAKQSEENSKASQIAANSSEEMASQKADEAKLSAEYALKSETNAKKSEENSLESANNSEEFALQSKSFAKGTGGIVRPNDDSDCAEYYYNQILQISQGIKGIIPMGTITFAELELPDNQHEGFMFNISDAFVSDERFNDGGGVSYGAGNNVIFTVEGKWDVLASSDVSGVKGDKETFYHQGFVNITPEDIGAAATDGDISNTTVSFEESENRENIESNEKLSAIFGKIKKIFSDLKTVAFSGDFNDLSNIYTATEDNDGLMSSKDKKIFDELVTNFLSKTYPIGSIYLSVNNINPSDLFGGEWVSWGSGRVPVGIDVSQTEFNTVEKAGGSKYMQNHKHTHPTHTHTFSGSGSSQSAGEHSHTMYWKLNAGAATSAHGVGIASNNTGTTSSAILSAGSHTHPITVSGTIGAGAVTDSGITDANGNALSSGTSGNLQPYITCYMWKRTA